MSIAVTPNDPRVRLFINNTWTDVYRRVRQAEGGSISIELGNDDEALGDEINPGKCSFTFDNMDGAFNPDNPMSPYWPFLSINVPVCVLLDELRDTYSRVATNTWGSADTGETYLTKSLNGAINATDFSTDGSVGKHSVPAVSAYRMSYFDASSGGRTAYNMVQKIRFTLPFTNVTGGPLEPGNLVCRMQSDTAYYMCRLTVEADESVKLSIFRDGGTVLAAAVTVPGVTNLAGQGIWVMFGAFDTLLVANAWVGDNVTDEPTGWLISATDTNYGYGWYGIRTGVSATNTNSLPIVVSYDHHSVYNSLFNGEIAEFPQEFSDDGVDMVVPISAGGILRRFAESKSPMKTPLRRYYEQLALVAPDKYWPLEEGEIALTGAASIGTGADIAHFVFTSDFGVDNSTEKHFGQAKLGAWMINGAQILDTDKLSILSPGSAVTNQRLAVQWVRTGGSQTHEAMDIIGAYAPGTVFAGIDLDAYGIEVNAFAKQITIVPGFTSAPVVLDTTLFDNNIFDGAAHHFHFRTNATGGAPEDLFWELIIDNVVEASATVADHPMIANLIDVFWNPQPDPAFPSTGPSKPVGIAHAAWFTGSGDPDSDISNVFDAFRGYAGELADVRTNRLCREHGITDFTISSNGQAMGPQFARDSLFEQFEEITRTDGGIFREDIGTRGLHYDTLTDLRARSTVLTLNVGGVVGSEPLAQGGFRPVRDPQRLKNKVVATKRAGGDYTFEKTTGRLGTADPKAGGAGEYEDEAKVNPNLDSQLITVAQREVAEGTIDKPRYPEITIDLMARSITTNTSLRRQVLRTFVSQRMKLTGMLRWHIFEDADLLVIGTKRTLTPYTHQITFNTIPFNSLDIFHVETAGSIMGTDSSYITTAITTTGTALLVATTGESLWTTSAGSMPILARMEGEDINITSIVTTPPTFRSVGAAVHADNATVTPPLPAGQLAGDALILVTAIRNTAAVADIPVGSGYAPIGVFTHFKIGFKYSVGAGEVAPNCTYSGGAAGDTTSAFIIALPSPISYITGNQQINGSAQDILYPACSLPQSNGLMLYLGWKQDDYTSVQPPLGLTEILEASTVTGNDQSLYAAYRSIPNASGSIESSGVLAVTGGAAAISKSTLLYLANPQQVTVTRSMNQVVKSHPALTSIRIAYPKVLG